MYDAIDERNTTIATLRASRDPAERDQVKGPADRRRRPPCTASTPPCARPSTTRCAATAIIDTNPALLVELPDGPTDPSPPSGPTNASDTWRDTGKIPSPVMVWTPEHTGQFLDHTHDADDRLYALYHLIAFTGLRRGEACGLHWDRRRPRRRHHSPSAGNSSNTAGPPPSTPPKPTTAKPPSPSTPTPSPSCAPTAPGNAANASPPAPPGPTTGLVFTTPPASRLHPADVTDHFHHLATPSRTTTHPPPRPPPRRRHHGPRRRRPHESHLQDSSATPAHTSPPSSTATSYPNSPTPPPKQPHRSSRDAVPRQRRRNPRAVWPYWQRWPALSVSVSR